MKSFVYFYMMRDTADTPDAIHQVVPAHVQYWKSRILPQYVGGPFADRTGGLITFAAPTLDDAQRIIRDDPFLLENLIEHEWIKEWLIE